MRNILTKIFAVMAMSVTTLTVWASPIAIPQDLGSYIVIGTATGTGNYASYVSASNCQVDAQLGDAVNNKYYTIGSTKGNTALSIHVTASEAGNYAFGFKSGASGCSSVVLVKMIADGSTTPIYTSEDVTIADNGSWTPAQAHNFYITGLEADANYTLSLEVKEITSGSYAGNFGNFFFHHVNQLGWATSSAYMELSDGTFTNARDNNDNVINYISRTGGSIDDLLIYNSAATCPLFHFNIDSHKQASKVTITVTDFATVTQEAQETIVVTGNGDYMQPLKTVISAGLKKIRFDFADNDDTADNDYLFNFRQVYFTLPLSLPIESALYLNQDGVIFNNAKWNDDGVINYIKAAGASIDNLYLFNGSESFYKFCFNISYIKQNSKVGITVTDMATGTVEIDNQTLEITTNGDKEMLLAKALSVGLKKIRFDFTDNDAGNADEHLFNFQTVTFPAVSYDPLPLTGNAVLDLSQWPTSGNPRYQSGDQNLGYIYHNNTAHFYVNNTNPAAHYYLSAGIRTNVSDANLIITVTDVATGDAEINEEAFDVAEGNSSYPIQTFALSGAITPGLKLITFKFTKDDGAADPWLYNIKNISFSMLRYTREHPHMNLNTLCFPYQIDSYTGATFYTILSTEVEAGELTKLVLEEHEGALEAGVPYFYDPTPGADELVCYYSGSEQATPQTASNGAFVGAYADDTAVPSGSYVTVNNQLYKCGANVTLAEYRAYVRPQAYTRAAIPGRRQLRIGGANMPTGIETVTGNPSPVTHKLIRNGQLLIIRDGKTYNAQGQLIEK